MTTLNETQALELFKISAELIIKIAQLKINWMNKENNNTIHINFELDQANTIHFDFPNFIESSEIIIDVENPNIEYSANRVSRTRYEITFAENLTDEIKIKLRHSDSEWNGWRYIDFHVLQNTLESASRKKVFSSLEVLESLSFFIESIAKQFPNEREIYDLKLALRSSLFREDWRKSNAAMRRAFEITSAAISPYTVGAHGYSFPLKSQGIEHRISKLPIIKTALDSLNLPWFCTSGTLLGLIRDASLIEFDDDLDFVVHIGHAETMSDVCSLYMTAYPLLCTIAHPTSHPFAFKLKGDVGAVDVFIGWTDSNHNAWIYPWCPGLTSADRIIPTNTNNTLSYPVNIPNSPEVCLSINYGEDWQTPDPTWRFNWDDAAQKFSESVASIRSILKEHL
jgi:hypothetical protein